MEHFAEARDLVRSFGIELVERLNAVFIQTLLFEEDVCEDHVLRIPLVDCPNETRCERCFRRSSRTDEKPERTRGNHGFQLFPLLGSWRSIIVQGESVSRFSCTANIGNKPDGDDELDDA